MIQIDPSLKPAPAQETSSRAYDEMTRSRERGSSEIESSPLGGFESVQRNLAENGISVASLKLTSPPGSRLALVSPKGRE